MTTEKVFWREIYEEDKDEVKIQLESKEPEISKKSSTSLQEHKVLHPSKYKKEMKEPVGFDFTYIDDLLSNMETIEKKIKWLQNFKTQLQQSQKIMAYNSWNLSTASALENQHKSMTPYIQTVSLAIREVQKKIQSLRDARKRGMRRKK